MREWEIFPAGIDMRTFLQWMVEQYDSKGAISLIFDDISRENGMSMDRISKRPVYNFITN